LISSPGPGRFIFPQTIAVQYIAGTIPYTVTGADAEFNIGWGGQAVTSDNAINFFPDAGFVDQATSQVYLESTLSNSSVPLSTALNSALVLAITDVLTLGNGHLNISISYSVLPAAL
jgi:hypothetical protein